MKVTRIEGGKFEMCCESIAIYTIVIVCLFLAVYVKAIAISHTEVVQLVLPVSFLS